MAVLWQRFGNWTRLLTFVLYWVPFWFAVWLAMKIVPGIRTSLVMKMSWLLDGTPIATEDLETSLGTLEYLKRVLRKWYIISCLQEAYAGQKAPDATVMLLDGQLKKPLLGLQKKSRPLVLSFGSCT